MTKHWLILGLVALLGATASFNAMASGGATAPGDPAQTDLGDTASLQCGARLFVNYCGGCHSMKLLRTSRIAEDLELTQAQVEQNLLFTGAKYGAPLEAAMPVGAATEWFGKAPPDLSMTGKVRGSDWIYNYLRGFYVDPTARIGWNNTVFPNASMPNVLWELQGTQRAVFKPMPAAAHGAAGHCAHGQAQVDGRCFVKFEVITDGTLKVDAFDRSVRDIATFMEYAAEPAALKRTRIGVWVILFLAFFTFIAWMLKIEYWRDVH
ncbi:MAG: cytochrome c1 [Lysobacterales bacterium]